MGQIIITGASGFVGSYVAQSLLQQGHQVTGFGTSKGHPLDSRFDTFTWVSADTSQPGDWQQWVCKSDVIINLTGRSIFKPWTTAWKNEIYTSRIKTTRNLVQAMGDEWNGQLLSASAAGIYGDRGDTVLSETEPGAGDFLAMVCRDWEAAAMQAADKGARVALMRLGVVLGQGGALKVMGRPFKAFVGGPLGSGRQFFPWIHIKDLDRALSFLINSEASGIYNFTGPVAVRQKDFARAFGRAMGRPSLMPAPAFMVKLIMGELGRSLLFSQRAVPSALAGEGFEFTYPSAAEALNDLYSKDTAGRT